MRMLLAVIVLFPFLLFAQTDQNKNIWTPFEFFIGKWEGTGGTGSIKSQVEAEYEFVLNNNYIVVTHKAVFPPQKDKPEGEIHEDRGFISYDRYRKKFVFRQFHIEGFVNQYILDSLSTDGKTLVFNSEQIENAPAGTRAQLTLFKTNENEINSNFNVAFPGKEFSCYSKVHLKRKK